MRIDLTHLIVRTVKIPVKLRGRPAGFHGRRYDFAVL